MVDLGRCGGALLRALLVFAILGAVYLMLSKLHRWRSVCGRVETRHDKGSLPLRLSATDPSLLLRHTTSLLGRCLRGKTVDECHDVGTEEVV